MLAPESISYIIVTNFFRNILLAASKERGIKSPDLRLLAVTIYVRYLTLLELLILLSFVLF